MGGQSEEIIETVVVSEKGQVSIPRDIRDKLGIGKGDRLIVVLKDGKMLIIPARRAWKENVEAEFDYLLNLSESTARNLWDNQTDERIWSNL
jgi:AbrB family looped-hinge helix DNA binding protein